MQRKTEKHSNIGIIRTNDEEVFVALTKKYSVSQQDGDGNQSYIDQDGEKIAYWEELGTSESIGYVASSPVEYLKWNRDVSSDESAWVAQRNYGRGNDRNAII